LHSLLLSRASTVASPSPAERRPTGSSSTGAAADGSGEAVLLPLDAVRDFLACHEVVYGQSLTVQDAHAALIDLDAYERRRVAAMEAERSRPPVQARPFDCTACGLGYLELDHHTGVHVCAKCGAVEELRSINVEPEYSGPSEAERAEVRSQCRKRRERGGHGGALVPAWLLARDMASRVDDGRCTAEARRSTLWAEMEHWNRYTQLCEIDLHEADVSLGRWTRDGRAAQRHTAAARVAAALLRPLVHTQFTTAREVRERTRLFQRPAVVVDPTPVPTFACPSCGAKQHTAKGARFHCQGAGFGKKRRRL
jgi:predicted RNA-binding Zn-ribbon protein involved in translation (DUF1610 family)